MGIDVTVHDSGSYLNTRATIMREGIGFAGNHPGTGRTGLYFDTSCANGGGAILAALALLSTGTGAWTNNGSPPCGGSVSLIASHPAFPTLTTASLQGWGCSLHAAWPTFPTDWSALAVATDPSLVSRPTCGVDPNTGLSACGQAYILVSGTGIVLASGSISLTPLIATNPTGTNHTVTAHVTTGIAPFPPIVGQAVTFTVTGTNAGAVGTCVPAGCLTNNNGDVTFTYFDANGVGNDTIKASFIDVNGSLQAATAAKTWVVAPALPPTIVKQFTPATIQVNGTSTLTITVTNPNSFALTGVAWSDVLPAGLTVTSAISNTCAGSNNNLVVVNGTMAANSSCTAIVTVTSNIAGTYPNTTSLVTSANAPGSLLPGTATLVVTALPVVPTATPTSTPIPPPPPRVIPQVFQNPAVQGIIAGPRSSTPTPIVRAVAVAPVTVDPGTVVIQPPRTGDAGLASRGGSPGGIVMAGGIVLLSLGAVGAWTLRRR